MRLTYLEPFNHPALSPGAPACAHQKNSFTMDRTAYKTQVFINQVDETVCENIVEAVAAQGPLTNRIVVIVSTIGTFLLSFSRVEVSTISRNGVRNDREFVRVTVVDASDGKKREVNIHDLDSKVIESTGTAQLKQFTEYM